MIFRDRSYSVLLVSSSAKFCEQTKTLLPMNEFWPVKTASSAGEARRMLAEHRFDLVLINTPLSDDFGIALASELCDSSAAGVMIFVSRQQYDDIYWRATERGIVCVSKPTNSTLVSQDIRVMCASIERIRKLEARQVTIEQKLEEMRTVNKAKWKLIESEGMSEEQAHKYIEQESMNRRISKLEMARGIIDNY